MLPFRTGAHFIRRPFPSLLLNANKAASFSTVCNNAQIPIATGSMRKCCNNATQMLQNKQFQPLWYGGILLRNNSSASNSNSPVGLARKYVRYGEPPNYRYLVVDYKEGRTGHQFIRFTKKMSGEYYDFSKLSVPADVVGFVRAMDELLGAVEANRDRIEAQPSRIQHQQAEEQPAVSVLHTARAEGTFYDFQLRLCLGRFLYVQLSTVRIQQKSKHEPREMDLPLQQFHWLRRAIGEVFVERGEQLDDQLQFGEPPGLPSWLRQIVVPSPAVTTLIVKMLPFRTHFARPLFNASKASSLAKITAQHLQNQEQQSRAFSHSRNLQNSWTGDSNETTTSDDWWKPIVKPSQNGQQETAKKQKLSKKQPIRPISHGRNLQNSTPPLVNSNSSTTSNDWWKPVVKSLQNGQQETAKKQMNLPKKQHSSSNYNISRPTLSISSILKFKNGGNNNAKNDGILHEDKQPSTTLAKKAIHYGHDHVSGAPKWLSIRYQRGKSGRKTLTLNKNWVGGINIHFPKILVPEDLVGFMRAMDELLGAVDANRDRIEAQPNPTQHQQEQQKPSVLVLHTATATGTNYDFQLRLCLGRSLYVELATVANAQKPEHRQGGRLVLPIGVFRWLRRAIGDVFVERGEQHLDDQLQFGEPSNVPL